MPSSIARFIKEKDSLTLAAAVVIGAALQDVVRSLVNDVIAPPINAYTNGFLSGEWVIKKPDILTFLKKKETYAPNPSDPSAPPSAATTTTTKATAGSNTESGAIVIKYGKFISMILQLFLVVYVAVKFAEYSVKLVNKFV
jgi:large-conductance mechanosensitive channel